MIESQKTVSPRESMDSGIFESNIHDCDLDGFDNSTQRKETTIK